MVYAEADLITNIDIGEAIESYTHEESLQLLSRSGRKITDILVPEVTSVVEFEFANPYRINHDSGDPDQSFFILSAGNLDLPDASLDTIVVRWPKEADAHKWDAVYNVDFRPLEDRDNPNIGFIHAIQTPLHLHHTFQMMRKLLQKQGKGNEPIKLADITDSQTGLEPEKVQIYMDEFFILYQQYGIERTEVLLQNYSSLSDFQSDLNNRGFNFVFFNGGIADPTVSQGHRLETESIQHGRNLTMRMVLDDFLLQGKSAGFASGGLMASGAQYSNKDNANLILPGMGYVDVNFLPHFGNIKKKDSSDFLKQSGIELLKSSSYPLFVIPDCVSFTFLPKRLGKSGF